MHNFPVASVQARLSPSLSALLLVGGLSVYNIDFSLLIHSLPLLPVLLSKTNKRPSESVALPTRFIQDYCSGYSIIFSGGTSSCSISQVVPLSPPSIAIFRRRRKRKKKEKQTNWRNVFFDGERGGRHRRLPDPVLLALDPAPCCQDPGPGFLAATGSPATCLSLVLLLIEHQGPFLSTPSSPVLS